jgi:hypothetical protein
MGPRDYEGRKSKENDMNRFTTFVAMLLLMSASALAQTSVADLMGLRDRIANPDTRTRVDATHKVWRIGVESPDRETKLTALQLLGQPVASASDHIRIPAVYAIVEIANSSSDAAVKTRALEMLAEPLRAGQVPIRDVAIDAVNNITSNADRSAIGAAAVKALSEPVRSGNNGVRIPAINALVNAVKGSKNEAANQAALDVLASPLESMAMIGGLEVRMFAMAAVERIGVESTDTATKTKALVLLRSYANKGGEAEAKSRANEAAARIEASMKK